MANKVILGARGSQGGLFVAKANKNADSTSTNEDDYMLFTGSSGTIGAILQQPGVGSSSATSTEVNAAVIVGKSQALVNNPSITGTSTSASVSKASTFTYRDLTYSNIADTVKYSAITDIF
jgi:hypothetical protein